MNAPYVKDHHHDISWPVMLNLVVLILVMLWFHHRIEALENQVCISAATIEQGSTMTTSGVSCP